MKIGYVCNRYHWQGYSVLRLLYEALQRRPGIEVSMCRRSQDVPANVDQIWIFGSARPIQNPHKKFMVVIGSTEPSEFRLARLHAADVYTTPSAVIHQKYPMTYYLPVFSDKRYFRPLPVKKTLDCVFLGVAAHPRVKNRRRNVLRIRKRGITVLAGGRDWLEQKHKYNRGLLAGRHLIQAFNRAHLVLDLMNKTTCMSSRPFQGPMCGVPVLTLKRDDMAQLFEPGKEMFFYENDAELPDVVEGLLKDKKRLAAVGKAARQRALRDHDVEARLDSLLEWTK